jgi:hypothetical protein
MATSAKTAANVDMAFLSAATNLVEMRKSLAAQQKSQGMSSMGSGAAGGGMNLHAPNRPTGTQSNCAAGSACKT